MVRYELIFKVKRVYREIYYIFLFFNKFMFKMLIVFYLVVIFCNYNKIIVIRVLVFCKLVSIIYY